MSINGTYTLTLWDQNHVRAVDSAPAFAIRGEVANASNFIWAIPTDIPKDTDTSAGASLRVYHYGAPKQIDNVYKNIGRAVSVLVLFCAPETYGKSMIVGHRAATYMKAIASSAVVDLTAAVYGQINNMWVFNDS